MERPIELRALGGRGRRDGAMSRGRRRGRGLSSAKLRERVYWWRGGYAWDLKGRLFSVGVDLGVSFRLMRNGEGLDRAASWRAPAVPLVGAS